MPAQTKTGTYTGTGAAITLQLGFIPDEFRAVNITDGDIDHIWFDGMTAGTTVDTGTAVVSNADNGVTRYAGTPGGNAAGLVLGTDLSESAKVYRYTATAQY